MATTSLESEIVDEKFPNDSNGQHSTDITIALDATLTRGSGLLILPKIKKIYFYSLDWSRLIVFSDTSKIHLFNAAVALELFEEFLERYSLETNNERVANKKLFCKTKPLLLENISEPETGASTKLQKQYKDFLIDLEKKFKAEPFQGEWKCIENNGSSENLERGDDDICMKIVRKLAKEDYKFHEKLPKLGNDGNVLELSEYSLENVSDSVSAMLALVSAVLQFPK